MYNLPVRALKTQNQVRIQMYIEFHRTSPHWPISSQSQIGSLAFFHANTSAITDITAFDAKTCSGQSEGKRNRETMKTRERRIFSDSWEWTRLGVIGNRSQNESHWSRIVACYVHVVGPTDGGPTWSDQRWWRPFGEWNIARCMIEWIAVLTTTTKLSNPKSFRAAIC